MIGALIKNLTLFELRRHKVMFVAREQLEDDDVKESLPAVRNIFILQDKNNNLADSKFAK